MSAPFVPDISHVIQLAVAPVFLLSGVGVTTGMLTNRLARIVDRARALEVRPHDPADTRTHGDLVALSRRANLINRALTLSTVCAILVSLVIIALFVSPMIDVDLSGLIAVLFIGGLIAYVVALMTFLREIFVATASLRIGRV
jgi:hypothetical protein